MVAVMLQPRRLAEHAGWAQAGAAEDAAPSLYAVFEVAALPAARCVEAKVQ